MTLETGILAGAVLLATIGWLYTARRARTLARKQHTFDALLNASFDRDFRNALELLMPYLRANKLPNINIDEENGLWQPLRMVLNHYEFIAASIRNGDIDEVMVRDSKRGTIITLFECSKNYIDSLRRGRRRRAIYEHLEWLHKRWEKAPPNRGQRCLEFILGHPLKGQVERVRD